MAIKYEGLRSSQEPEGEKNYIDPTADGWIKTAGGYWARRTDKGVEFLGNTSPRGVLTPEQIQSYYQREKELEERVKKGSKKAEEELDSVRKQIWQLERYGPAVMGGE